MSAGIVVKISGSAKKKEELGREEKKEARIEFLNELLDSCWRYAHDFPPSQRGFLESLSKQFDERKWLSWKQIGILKSMRNRAIKSPRAHSQECVSISHGLNTPEGNDVEKEIIVHSTYPHVD